MSDEPTTSAAAAAPPTIHEAELMPGPLGVVWYGAELDFDAAVACRRVGADVVVRGDDSDINRRLAYRIKAAVGPPTRPQATERNADPHALPHFHQQNCNPGGHLFYETERRKARKRP